MAEEKEEELESFLERPFNSFLMEMDHHGEVDFEQLVKLVEKYLDKQLRDFTKAFLFLNQLKERSGAEKAAAKLSDFVEVSLELWEANEQKRYHKVKGVVSAEPEIQLAEKPLLEDLMKITTDDDAQIVFLVKEIESFMAKQIREYMKSYVFLKNLKVHLNTEKAQLVLKLSELSEALLGFSQLLEEKGYYENVTSADYDPTIKLSELTPISDLVNELKEMAYGGSGNADAKQVKRMKEIGKKVEDYIMEQKLSYKAVMEDEVFDIKDIWLTLRKIIEDKGWYELVRAKLYTGKLYRDAMEKLFVRLETVFGTTHCVLDHIPGEVSSKQESTTIATKDGSFIQQQQQVDTLCDPQVKAVVSKQRFSQKPKTNRRQTRNHITIRWVSKRNPGAPASSEQQ